MLSTKIDVIIVVMTNGKVSCNKLPHNNRGESLPLVPRQPLAHVGKHLVITPFIARKRIVCYTNMGKYLPPLPLVTLRFPLSNPSLGLPCSPLLTKRVVSYP